MHSGSLSSLHAHQRGGRWHGSVEPLELELEQVSVPWRLASTTHAACRRRQGRSRSIGPKASPVVGVHTRWRALSYDLG